MMILAAIDSAEWLALAGIAATLSVALGAWLARTSAVLSRIDERLRLLVEDHERTRDALDGHGRRIGRLETTQAAWLARRGADA